MMHARRSLIALGVVGAVAIVAAGCGGAAPTTSGSGVTPDASSPTPGSTVGGTSAAGAGTDASGGTIAGGTPVGGATAGIPNIDAGSLKGRGINGGTKGGLFDALAVDPGSQQQTTPLDTTPLPTTPTATTPTPAEVFTGATIYVDGMTYDVAKGDSFPTDNPLFKLTSVSANSIELELVAGEFTDGGGTGTVLDKGDLVSLVNASEQKTYKVKYVRGQSSSSVDPASLTQ